MKKIFLVPGFLFFIITAFCQGFNNNPGTSYLNIALPRTPESQSFEKYGNIPVEEFSGTPGISIPLYSLKSRFLEVPISLSYHPSGIKVAQEATWAGLGFDIMAGGRITVETKGNIDENVRTSYTNNAQFKTGLTRLFNRFGGSYHTSLLGYGFLDYCKITGMTASECHVNDTAWDNEFTVGKSAWFGISEPDIYHANFMGNSLNFYIDLITDQVKFVGEKSLYVINVQRDALERITKFIITDNNGINYYFEQKEKTTLTAPPFYGQATAYQSTTAWLLTKVEHPTGDNIVFTYSGYGKTYPVFNWSSSIATTRPSNVVDYQSQTWPQNQVEQEPFYLSKIESNNASVDFILSTRSDVRGPGARKLDTIKLKNKLTNEVIKNICFDYSYFISGAEPGEGSLADSIKQYYRKRLKLLSLKINDGTASPTHYFYYNSNVPGKLSFSQDHWGYYNGASNAFYSDVTSPQNLIPSFADLGFLATRSVNHALGCLTSQGAGDSYSIPPAFDGYAGSRSCNPWSALSMTLDSIVYPTGGSTKFVYEPHHSSYRDMNLGTSSNDFVGGGLRIKTIKNYSFTDKLENSTDYYYESFDGGPTSGIYLGGINYLKVSNKFLSGTTVTMSSSGDINADNLTVGYSRVKIISKDGNNQGINGYKIKYYNVSYPFEVQYKEAMAPFWRFGVDIHGNPCSGDPAYAFYYCSPPFDVTGVRYLLKNWINIPPTPARSLDGKLYMEEQFDNANNLVKSTNYYYRQADYSQNFYSLKVEDNYAMSVNTFDHYVGFVSAYGLDESNRAGYGCDNGSNWRRWSLCMSPAKSYYTLLDSVVDKTYSNNNTFITQKKAYKYNSYYQPEYESIYDSDGTQIITYTRTSLNLAQPAYALAPSGDAVDLYNLKAQHIYDLPVEQIAMKKNSTGDTIVLSSRFNVYQGVLLKKSYTLEWATPLAFRSQFIPYYMTYANYPNAPSGSTCSLKIDDKYKISETALYNSASQIKELTAKNGISSYIWDTYNSYLLAQCINAAEADIAYTSFETDTYGNWTVIAAGVSPEITAPTGVKGFALLNKNITKTGLNSSKTYIVSYWSKNGSQNVNGATTTAGKTIGNWSYFEHTVVNPSGGNITVSGSGNIDELRLYPKNALMTTYAYKPLIGMTSQCDANNTISYYEYDAMGRLARIRDFKGNIIKQMDYKYGDVFQFPYGNTQQSQTWTKQDCPTGYAGSQYTHTVPANKYGSFTSVTDANQKALAEIGAIGGQEYVDENGTCEPYYTWTTCCGWGSVYHNFYLTDPNTVYVSFVVQLSGGPVVGSLGYLVGTLWGPGFVPTGTRSFNVAENGRTWEVTVLANGQIHIKPLSGQATGHVYITGTYTK